jgi:hypothetical protein
MDEVLQVRAALQEWVAKNHNNPDVPRIQKVINDLAFACSPVLVLIQNA